MVTPNNTREGDGTQRPLWVYDAGGWLLAQPPTPDSVDITVNPPLNLRMEKEQHLHGHKMLVFSIAPGAESLASRTSIPKIT